MSPWFGPALVTDAPQSLFGCAALEVMQREIDRGAGETTRDNDGPDVRRYARSSGSPGNWCAALVSYCIEEGALALGRPCPVKRSHSARRLWKRCGQVGAFVEEPLPGDIVCWWRFSIIDLREWRGHIGIVSRVDGGKFWSGEGNRGRFPSKAREFSHELGEARLMGFARLP